LLLHKVVAFIFSNVKVYQSCLKIIQGQLDVNNIIAKINDVEKIKAISMSGDQKPPSPDKVYNGEDAFKKEAVGTENRNFLITDK